MGPRISLRASQWVGTGLGELLLRVQMVAMVQRLGGKASGRLHRRLKGRCRRWLPTASGGLGLRGGLGGGGGNQGGSLRGGMVGDAQFTAGGVEVWWRE